MAKGKYIRRTPRKARLVAELVQGMRVAEALAALEFSPKHAATDVAKVIKSAAANAEHNFNLSRDELWVKQLLVDEGPTMKRIRPVSRGMAHQYFHRTCHITAVVEDRPEVEQPRAARPRPAARRARPAAPRPAAKPEAAAELEEAPVAAPATPVVEDSQADAAVDVEDTAPGAAAGESEEKE